MGAHIRPEKGPRKKGCEWGLRPHTPGVRGLGAAPEACSEGGGGSAIHASQGQNAGRPRYEKTYCQQKSFFLRYKSHSECHIVKQGRYELEGAQAELSNIPPPSSC